MAIPEVVYVWMVDAEAIHCSYTKNPLKLDNNKISYLACLPNGEERPTRPFKLHFENGHYVEPFVLMNLFSNKNYMDGNGISYYDYGNGFTIFVFDLTEDFSGHDFIKSRNGIGTLKLEGQFKDALPHITTLFSMGYFMNTIMIDAGRNVTKDY